MIQETLGQVKAPQDEIYRTTAKQYLSLRLIREGHTTRNSQFSTQQLQRKSWLLNFIIRLLKVEELEKSRIMRK
jgi:hypothetical protein